jgi:formylglycine-generating enzyme required for sulfatase activity
MLSDTDFVKIPAGDYTIGLSDDNLESAYRMIRNTSVKQEFVSSSFPAHTVHIDDVLIRKFLVTCEEFSMFIADTGYITEAEKEGWGWVLFQERWQKRDGVSWRRPFGSHDDERYRGNVALPVMQVSWNDALEYCAWLSNKIGERARLPREAEWEVFAFLSGVAGAGECTNEHGAVSARHDFLETIHEAINAGVRFSTGLLWEWTEDWYDRYPGGINSKEYGRTYRVLRGGSAISMSVQRTREFRLRKCPTARSPYYGFRIAIAG